MSNSDYQDVPGAGFKESKSVYGATGGAASVAAGRVSYCLGLYYCLFMLISYFFNVF
jgi:acyl transferase domain-containing protein